MTFRARLVLAATGAVLVVVVLGSLATYLVAYNSLVGAVDVTLRAEAQPTVVSIQTGAVIVINNECPSPGSCLQVVNAAGATNPTDPSV